MQATTITATHKRPTDPNIAASAGVSSVGGSSKSSEVFVSSVLSEENDFFQ